MTFTDFAGAAAFIAAGRSKTERPAATNTRVRIVDADTIALRLHTTDVVVYHRDGRFVLNTGGWYTKLTAARMEEFSPFRFSRTTMGTWTVLVGTPNYSDEAERNAYWASAHPYADGMTLSATAVIDGPDPVAFAAAEKHNKMVRGVTARAFKRWSAAGSPTDYGICEQCNALAGGEPVLSTTHLDEHIAAMLAGAPIPDELLYTVTYEGGYASDRGMRHVGLLTKWLRNRLYTGAASSGPHGRRPAIVTGRSMSWQSRAYGQAA